MDEPTNQPADERDIQPEGRESTRLQLLLDVFIFQFKLAADGLRDILLSPLSIISAIMGLVSGGDDPERYFRELKRLGRRSELWINLFGQHKKAGTSDDFIAPIRQKMMAEAQNNPWISKAGGELNRTLDSVSSRIRPTEEATRKNAGKESPED